MWIPSTELQPGLEGPLFSEAMLQRSRPVVGFLWNYIEVWHSHLSVARFRSSLLEQKESWKDREEDGLGDTLLSRWPEMTALG